MTCLNLQWAGRGVTWTSVTLWGGEGCLTTSVPSGEPGFKWGKERGTLRGDVEDTRLLAGV